MKTEFDAPINVIDGVYGADAMLGGHTGLTKLELATFMTMQGLCAGTSRTDSPEWIAERSKQIAIATINELNRAI